MKRLYVTVAIVMLVYACGNRKNEVEQAEEAPKSKMVMAEVSELAQLMKHIHADAKDWRKMLVNGEMVEAEGDIFAALTESTPTNANVKGPVYEGFSAHYQEKLNAFLAAENVELAKEQYNNLVSACVQCHQSYCTGPIPTIEKLYIK